jgi:hypothetical protein
MDEKEEHSELVVYSPEIKDDLEAFLKDPHKWLRMELKKVKGNTQNKPSEEREKQKSVLSDLVEELEANLVIATTNRDDTNQRFQTAELNLLYAEINIANMSARPTTTLRNQIAENIKQILHSIQGEGKI